MFLKGNWDTATFITTYITFIGFPILYYGSKLYYGTSPVALEYMNFVSDIAQIEVDSYEDPSPKNAMERFWKWLVSGVCTAVQCSSLIKVALLQM